MPPHRPVRTPQSHSAVRPLRSLPVQCQLLAARSRTLFASAHALLLSFMGNSSTRRPKHGEARIFRSQNIGIFPLIGLLAIYPRPLSPPIAYHRAASAPRRGRSCGSSSIHALQRPISIHRARVEFVRVPQRAERPARQARFPSAAQRASVHTTLLPAAVEAYGRQPAVQYCTSAPGPCCAGEQRSLRRGDPSSSPGKPPPGCAPAPPFIFLCAHAVEIWCTTSPTKLCDPHKFPSPLGPKTF